MRKTTFFLSIAVATSLVASEVSKVKSDFSDMNFFKNKGVTILGTSKVDDISLVSAMVKTPQGSQKITVFVTKDKKNVIVGAGYNDKTGEQLLVPINMSGYAKDAVMTLGHGKDVLYVFSDPECPYCIKMEKEVLEKIPLDKFTVHVFLFPLSFHPHSEAMSLYILSKKDNVSRIKALQDITNGSQDFVSASYTEKQRTNLQKQLSKQKDLAKELGVNGTPSMFNSKGNPVNWTMLLQDKK